MAFFLNLFTGTTWEEFQKAGANVTGFRENSWKRAERIKKGDIFLCYMVGVKRWVGLLEVLGERYRDEVAIWDEEVFPVRFSVKPIIMLTPETGVPMEEFEGKVSFFEEGANSRQWSGLVRSSATKYKDRDGKAIEAAITTAEEAPVSRNVDPKKLKRSANLYKTKINTEEGEVEAVLSVPSDEDEEDTTITTSTTHPDEVVPSSSHTEIQYRLLELGSKMGLKIWAPKNDRNRVWDGKTIAEIPRLLDSLPTNFDDVTNRIVENIDVIWMSNENAIVAAFEVEHSTAIYSGLLRMSDLLTMQPNIDIKLYIVAPDERYDKFRRELPRPTFAYRKKPLHSVCGFVPYSRLCETLDAHSSVMKYLKPEFLEDITEYYDPAEEVDA